MNHPVVKTEKLTHGVEIRSTEGGQTEVAITLESNDEPRDTSVVLSRAYAQLAEAIGSEKGAQSLAEEGEPQPATPPGSGGWWQG